MNQDYIQKRKMRAALADKGPPIEYDIEDLRKRYRSIDESTTLPKDQLNSVVESVNAVSR